MEDPSSEEERDTTDAETDAEATLDEESWCPPVPDTPDDPTENEITGAADKLEPYPGRRLRPAKRHVVKRGRWTREGPGGR